MPKKHSNGLINQLINDSRVLNILTISESDYLNTEDFPGYGQLYKPDRRLPDCLAAYRSSLNRTASKSFLTVRTKENNP